MKLARPLPLIVTAATAVLSLAAGCTGDTGPVAPPSFNFTGGPPSPGPFIVRIGNAGSRVITTDPEDGLLAIHGKVLDLTACTDASTRVPVDIQIVRTPADAQSIALLLVGDDNEVAVYDQGDPDDLVPFDPVKFCGFIATTTPVYTGLVRYRLSQNGQGNVLFQWGGFVTRVADGVALPYVEMQYGVPRGDGTLDFIIEDIRINENPR